MKIIRIGMPSKIGFYQLKLYRSCEFALFSNSLETEVKLKSPGQGIHAIQGVLFHDLIEKLQFVADPMERLTLGKKYIEEQSQKMRNDPTFWWMEPLFSYSQTSSLLSKIVNFVPRLNNDRDSRSFFEYDIQTADKLFFGRVDKIIFSKDQIKIHEYKSTLANNTNTFINEHRDQLEFYAAILFEEHSDVTIVGELFSSELSPLQIEIDREKSLESLDEIRKEISSTILKVNSPELLQNPTQENCLNCKLKPICSSFLSVHKEFVEFEGAVISGTLLAKSKASQFLNAFDFNTDSGKVSVLASKFHPFSLQATIGKAYTVSELKMSHNKFEFSPRTVIYETK